VSVSWWRSQFIQIEEAGRGLSVSASDLLLVVVSDTAQLVVHVLRAALRASRRHCRRCLGGVVQTP